MMALDRDLRREYEQAMAAVPDLVRLESNAQHFLETEHGNAPQAAQRLALYWKYRKQIFGPDRWLLPLTCTGNGALDMQDIAVLRTGYMVNLARPPQGPPLILIDMSRLPIHCEVGAIETRLTYYGAAVHYSSHSPSSSAARQTGISLLHLVSSKKRPPVNLDLLNWRIVRTAMPFRVKDVTVLQAFEDGREILLENNANQQAAVVNFRSGGGGGSGGGFLPQPVAGRSVHETLQLMNARGVERSCLPRFMGGTYDYSVFSDWIRMRMSLESVLSSSPVMANTRLYLAASAAASACDTDNSTIAMPFAAVATNDKAIVDSTCGQPTICQQLQQQHQQQHEQQQQWQRQQQQKQQQRPLLPAQVTHRRLLLPPVKTPAPPKRRRNNHNSTIAELQEQEKGIQLQNELVRRENRRLEASLARARLLVAVHHEVRGLMTGAAAAASAAAAGGGGGDSSAGAARGHHSVENEQLG